MDRVVYSVGTCCGNLFLRWKRKPFKVTFRKKEVNTVAID